MLAVEMVQKLIQYIFPMFANYELYVSQPGFKYATSIARTTKFFMNKLARSATEVNLSMFFIVSFNLQGRLDEETP